MDKTAIIVTGIRAGVSAINPAYVLGDPTRLTGDVDGVVVHLSDPATGESVPLVWSKRDEDRNDGDNLIDFIASFARNAADSLTDMIRFKAPQR